MEKFFIVGCPRSGTTMVQQALNRHSQIVVPPETKFFFSFFGHPRKRQARHVERINADLGIQLPQPTKQIASLSDGRAYYEEMARQYVDRNAAKDVVHFGEKTPEHTGLLPSIRRLYPEAKILVLVRDGRDVASSMTRMPWMSPNLYVNFIVWLYYNSIIEQERLSGCRNMYVAQYEDIAANPQEEFKAILRFLGAGYEPAVAAGCGNREGVPQREMAWKSRALQPITKERIGVFRKELTGDQIEILERLGKEALSSLGYPLLTDGERSLSPAFYMHLAYHLARFVGRLPWNSVAKELVSRLFSGVSTERPFAAVSPFAYHAARDRRSAVAPAAQV
jgi:Sulfotransferase family